MSRLISYCILLLVKFHFDGCSLNVLVRIVRIFSQNGHKYISVDEVKSL